MRVLLAIVGLFGVVLAYRRFRPFARQTRLEDVGAVSEDWRAQQRRLSDER